MTEKIIKFQNNDENHDKVTQDNINHRDEGGPDNTNVGRSERTRRSYSRHADNVHSVRSMGMKDEIDEGIISPII